MIFPTRVKLVTWIIRNSYRFCHEVAGFQVSLGYKFAHNLRHNRHFFKTARAVSEQRSSLKPVSDILKIQFQIIVMGFLKVYLFFDNETLKLTLKKKALDGDAFVHENRIYQSFRMQFKMQIFFKIILGANLKR